jgi:hypothetical protein
MRRVKTARLDEVLCIRSGTTHGPGVVNDALTIVMIAPEANANANSLTKQGPS